MSVMRRRLPHYRVFSSIMYRCEKPPSCAGSQPRKNNVDRGGGAWKGAVSITCCYTATIAALPRVLFDHVSMRETAQLRWLLAHDNVPSSHREGGGGQGVRVPSLI